MVGLMGIVTQSNWGHQYQVIRSWQLGLYTCIFGGENYDKPPTLGVPHISDRSSNGFIFPSSPPEEHDSSATIAMFSTIAIFLLSFLVVRLDPPEILFQRPTYPLLMVSHHELSCLTIQSQLRSIRISDGHMCISDHMFCILCRLLT